MTNSRFAVAVHVLTLMAWSEDEPLKSEQVAESVNTNPVVIRRMLCELAQANLVISQTGAMGGSKLTRKPSAITLLDVYRALEFPGVFSLHRQPPSRRCPVGVNIETVLSDVLQEVDSAVERVLEGITINDLVGRLKPCVSTATANRNLTEARVHRSVSTAARNRNGVSANRNGASANKNGASANRNGASANRNGASANRNGKLRDLR